MAIGAFVLGSLFLFCYLALSLLVYLRIIEDSLLFEIVVNFMIVAVLSLPMIGAHCLDKLDAEVLSGPRYPAG